MKIRLKIAGKLQLGFAIILVVILINSILTYLTLENSRKVNDQITKIYSPSVTLLNDLVFMITNSKMLIKNWVYIDKKDNTPDKIRLKELHKTVFPELINSMQYLVEQWSEEKQELFENICTSISDTLFEKHKFVMQQLNSFENYDDAFIVFDVNPMVEDGGEIMLLTDKILEQLSTLVEMQENVTNQALAEMESSFNSFQIMIILLSLIIVIIAITIALITTRALVKPIYSIQNVILSMGQGILPKQKLELGYDEIGDMAKALNLLIEGLKKTASFATEIGKGNLNQEYQPLSKSDALGLALNKMASSLREVTNQNEKQNWIKTGQNDLNEKMRGDVDINSLSRNIIIFLAKYLNAQIGTFYVCEENNTQLTLAATYAFSKRKSLKSRIEIGEGLIGQAALEKEIFSISEMPADYIRINSGLGETNPKNIIVVPVVLDEKLMGVFELGSINEFSELDFEFLKSVSENIAISINSAIARKNMKDLLTKTQQLADEMKKQKEELRIANDEMQVQQEELRVANEELEEQTKALKDSEQSLQLQQEELRVTNEELEEKTKSLEIQKKKITEKNIQLELAKDDIEIKAKELEISSKYKSEFLANMSHELRTPLNSLLILSQNLSNNKHKNLKDDQVEAAQIINKSGHDLLNLINEILDLSKIESGKMAFEIEEFEIEEIASEINLYFQHVIDEKGLNLEVDLSKDLPPTISSDRQRLEQIIKNLMSNAIKFTDQGGINVKISRPKPGTNLSKSKLPLDKALAIAISDTGIGIPKDKQMSIFEAFQQADGGTARKYGGTGLGLSISREIVKILGGEIQLESEVGKGSTFTVIIPFVSVIAESEIKKPNKSFVRRERTEIRRPEKNKLQITKPKEYGNEELIPFVDDDRNDLSENDRKILIVEDDLEFAKILLMQCHEKNFKCIVSPTGEDGLALCEKYLPEAVILDIKLPGIDGLSVLDLIKENPATRHIPVHMMSAFEETIDAYKRGAIGYLMKPAKPVELEAAIEKIETFIERKMKDLLVVEDDENLRKIISGIIGDQDVNTRGVGTGSEAIECIKNESIDCIVLDLGLPDMSGFELLNKLEKEKNLTIPPIIIYTGKDLTREENEKLQKYTNSIIIKGVKSEERLLDETALFLHRVVSKLPQHQQKVISNLHNKEAIFEKKKILIVDDDIRNIFALTQILEDRGMIVHKAENGVKALELLDKQTNIDLILMDIMMPVMDGYEATKKIREQNRYKKIPIIALTAKAMKGDKEKCIAAGTNDYLSKPVNIDKLLSLMRVWMYK